MGSDQENPLTITESVEAEEPASHSGQRVECVIAAIVLLPPFLYLVTDCSPNAAFWRYSPKLLGAILFYSLFAAGVLLSYRIRLGSILAGLRTWMILLGFSLLLSALAGEFLLRAMSPSWFTPIREHGQYAADPDVGHRYLPNRNQVIVTREFRTPWRTNAQGVRADRDFGPKPPGVYRILAIGDSFTVGDQVALAQTWPGVLEAKLEQEFGSGNVEVINAGCAAYGTINEARWIAKFAPTFEPDLVVLAMTPNDLIENRLPFPLSAANGALIDADASEAVRQCRAEHRRWYSVPGMVNRSRIRNVVSNIPAYRRWRYGTAFAHYRAYEIEQDESSRKQYQRAQDYLLEAREASSACGAQFALISIPFKEQLGELEPGLSPTVFGERIKRFADQNDIPFADCLPVFVADANPASLYMREDGHCNAKGYRVIGETAFALVRNLIGGKREH